MHFYPEELRHALYLQREGEFVGEQASFSASDEANSLETAKHDSQLFQAAVPAVSRACINTTSALGG